MKIWVVGRGVPSTKNRMLGHFELGQAQMLAKRMDVVYLAQAFTCMPKNYTPGFAFSAMRQGEIDICCRTIFYFPTRFNIYCKEYLKAAWITFFKKVEKKFGKPDIIHIHYPTMICDPDAVMEYKQQGIKIVCTEHWTKVLTGKINVYEKKQLMKFVDIADAFICVGLPLKSSVEKICGAPENVIVIPNVVSDLFHPIRWNAEYNTSFKFVAVGRMVPVKQFDKITLAFSEVHKKFPQTELTIIGDGPERTKVESIVKSKFLFDSVLFTGTLSRENVAKEVANADCLICFSNLETFGVPIIEAWACGIPAIASDCLGFSEYWNNRLGIIVSHDNIQDLENAMCQLITGYARYDPKYISNFANQYFGESAILDKLLDVYSN